MYLYLPDSSNKCNFLGWSRALFYQKKGHKKVPPPLNGILDLFCRPFKDVKNGSHNRSTKIHNQFNDCRRFYTIKNSPDKSRNPIQGFVITINHYLSIFAKKKLRIAVNTRFLLPNHLEGFGWYTHEIVSRMVKNHPEDTFIFLFDRDFDPRFVYGSNVIPVVVNPPARHPILFFIWFELRLPSTLKRYKAEVFFSPDSMCSLRTEVPTVMTIHDLIPLHYPTLIQWKHRRYLLHFLPLFAKKAQKILTVSEFVKSDIIQTLGIDSNRIEAIYNGCRDNFVPLDLEGQAAVRLKFSEGKPYFFYSGAIHPRKNIGRLIKAFDQFKQGQASEAKLLLAGRMAWQTDEVTEALAQSPFRSDIVMLGYVAESDLPRLVSAALALVYVSMSEGFGLPMLEAMHCETPVIAANASCLPEIAGEAALLVDPLSIQDIGAAMATIYTQPLLAQDLIEKGRKQRLKFNWDLAAEQVYQSLVQTAKKRED